MSENPSQIMPDEMSKQPKISPDLIPERMHMEVLCDIFDKFALKDQENYYESAIEKNRLSAREVKLLQALFAFLGGLASAIIGLLEATDNSSDELIIPLVIVAVVAPGVGATFGSLISLFQWDRLMTVYDDTLKSILVADAMSPRPSVKNDVDYYTQMLAFVDASLDIMREETGQFGSMIRSSQQIDEFVKKSTARAEEVTKRYYKGMDSSGSSGGAAG